MSVIGANSLATTPQTTSEQEYDDSALEGVASHIRLLLKLIQDHKDACDKEKNGSRRMPRVATMMTVLDNVRTRMQKCQSFGKRSEAELQQCNTGTRKQGINVVVDEKEMLRRELSASLVARKGIEIVCSSLGKEKEIMAAELSRKVLELSGMEELITDLKAQNETLLKKVRKCGLEHEDNKYDRRESEQGSLALQDLTDFEVATMGISR